MRSGGVNEKYEMKKNMSGRDCRSKITPRGERRCVRAPRFRISAGGLSESGLLLRRVEPGRPDAGYRERGHDAMGFAKIVPAHAGDFEHGETFGAECQHPV